MGVLQTSLLQKDAEEFRAKHDKAIEQDNKTVARIIDEQTGVEILLMLQSGMTLL